jgi:hypothetical protein
VSHWTDNDVARAKAFSSGKTPANPDFVLEESFSELLGILGVDGKRAAFA